MLRRLWLLLSSSFFILSAYAQINDPDPLLWIIVYFNPAILSIASAFNLHLKDYKIFQNLTKFVAFMYCCFGGYILFSSNIQSNLFYWILHDEAGREFGGIMISALWIWCLSNSTRDFSVSWLLLVSSIVIIPTSIWIYLYFDSSLRKLWPMHCQSVVYSSVES